MDPITLSYLIVGFMFLMIVVEVPIGVAMGIAGFVGLWFLEGPQSAFYNLGDQPFQVLQIRELASIPMFLLMGTFASAAGLSRDLYRLFNALFGWAPGGLSMATVAGCGGFGAICGSSIATASTFMRVAYPEMKKRGYHDKLSVGCIAAGGTLGILIPPSGIMILYGVLTENDPILLFKAALVPGLVTIAIYFTVIQLIVFFSPDKAPRGGVESLREIIAATANAWGVILLAGIIAAGIYGVDVTIGSFTIQTPKFTVVEAAAVGCIAAFFFMVMRVGFRAEIIFRAMKEAAATTGMLYIVIMGAKVIGQFVALAGLPEFVANGIVASGMSTAFVIALLLVMYLILGAIFDTVSAMILTLPVVYPLVTEGLGIEGMTIAELAIWWGIVNIIVIEIGQTTPPIGIVPFVLNGMRPEVKLNTIFSGIIPFFAGDILRLILITSIPALTIWLPTYLGAFAAADLWAQ